MERCICGRNNTSKGLNRDFISPASLPGNRRELSLGPVLRKSRELVRLEGMFLNHQNLSLEKASIPMR